MDKEASLGEVCFAANTAISLPFLYNHFHEIAKLFPIEHFTVSSDAKHIQFYSFSKNVYCSLLSSNPFFSAYHLGNNAEILSKT